MKAMLLKSMAKLSPDSTPLQMADLPEPSPGAGEILIRVSACGVCHTELDEIEGRMPPAQLPMVLGHQVVGRVVALGAGVGRFQMGERVGVASSGWEITPPTSLKTRSMPLRLRIFATKPRPS